MNKTAVVTGAGSGIGKTIATVLALRGYRVVATDINEEAAARVAAELHSSHGQSHAHARLNVSDPVEAREVVENISKTNNLDCWINNAGISFMEEFLKIPIERYDQTMEINLKGVFVCGQAAAREMVRTEVAGSIVNIASMGGKNGNIPYLSDYVASKFGVVGLTQSMAYELAPHGIRVNSVCPGFVQTPMQDRELVWEGKLRGLSPEQVKLRSISATPLGRLQKPEEVANAVAFLLSPDAEFITGEALAVNGGVFMD